MMHDDGERRDGVWFVDLSPISDENLVAKEITEVLKIPEVPNQSIIDTLIEKIKKFNFNAMFNLFANQLIKCRVGGAAARPTVPFIIKFQLIIKS